MSKKQADGGNRFVLALDSGSQSSRALLFDAGGAVAGVGRATHAPMRHPAEGAVEQDPIDIRDCLFSAIRECLKTWGGDRSRIAGAALTTQRTTVLPVDAGGRPLLDAVSWLDRREASVESEPSPVLRLALKTLGKEAMIPRLLAKSWARQWREREPEVLGRMTWIAPVEAWLVHQLTGRMALAPGGVVGPWPFDVKKRAWSRSPILYKLLGFEKRWLPEIVEAGEAIGAITPEAARATGLPEGLAVFACGGDKQAEALGAGVRVDRGGVAAVSLGTGSSISLPWPKPRVSLQYHWFTMASAEPGSWSLEYLLFRGMWTVRWFARELARDLEARAGTAGDGPCAEALLVDEAARVPAGAGGLVTWPRWSPSLQHPAETGSSIGFRETHGRGHIFRSLLEGIAFDLRRGMGILEGASRSRVREIRVGGGGARSDLVVQILADVLGLPVVRPPSEELAARGAAIVAAAGARLHPTLRDAVEAMVPAAPIIQPDPKHSLLYDRIYRRVYLPGLDRCRELSERLAAELES